jgi:hypothetical protein
MADFAVWVAAAEEALPWAPGSFLEAYAGNRAEADESALEGDPVAVAVRDLMATRDEWGGTATELYAAIAELVDEDVRRSRAWPSAPNSLSNRMKRIAPSLRETGIEYADGRSPGGSRTRRKSLKKIPETDRPGRPERPSLGHDSVETTGFAGTSERDTGDGRDDASRGHSARERFVL